MTGRRQHTNDRWNGQTVDGCQPLHITREGFTGSSLQIGGAWVNQELSDIFHRLMLSRDTVGQRLLTDDYPRS